MTKLTFLFSLHFFLITRIESSLFSFISGKWFYLMISSSILRSLIHCILQKKCWQFRWALFFYAAELFCAFFSYLRFYFVIFIFICRVRPSHSLVRFVQSKSYCWVRYECTFIIWLQPKIQASSCVVIQPLFYLNKILSIITLCSSLNSLHVFVLDLRDF